MKCKYTHISTHTFKDGHVQHLWEIGCVGVVYATKANHVKVSTCPNCGKEIEFSYAKERRL